MSCNIEIGIIEEIDKSRDYSVTESGISYAEHIRSYSCISIPDEELSGLIAATVKAELPVSFCTVSSEHSAGIDPCGVTLLPPSSAEKLLPMLEGYSGAEWYSGLAEICRRSATEGKYMIIFGI